MALVTTYLDGLGRSRLANIQLYRTAMVRTRMFGGERGREPRGSFLSQFRKEKHNVNKLSQWLMESALKRRGRVTRDGKVLFTMRNYSRTTAMRLRRFFTKEPDTLHWIDTFEPGSVMLDIGANVGSYSLYAAYRKHRVFALEPDALNFALLNLNISDNGMNDRVMAYPFAIHDSTRIAELNMSAFKWGGALNSFDRALDWRGERLQVVFRQGSAGITVDDFVAQTGVPPNYIKIDVDGNELCVLSGARGTLRSTGLRGVLVELAQGHAEYVASVKTLTDAGFALQTRVSATKRAAIDTEMAAENHIFCRLAG